MTIHHVHKTCNRASRNSSFLPLHCNLGNMFSADDVTLSPGVTYTVLDSPLVKEFEAASLNNSGTVHLQPHDLVMPGSFLRYQKLYSEFKVEDDDVWISSFPKCGRNTQFFRVETG